MALSSLLFKNNQALQACAVSNPAHITPGSTGEHVARLQKALQMLDNAIIDATEIKRQHYGPSTASAVLEYKRQRNIINRSYQSAPDNVVGIMTIAAMDKELNEYPTVPPNTTPPHCTRRLA